MLTIKTPRGEFTEIFRQLYQTFSSVDLPDTIETDKHLSDYVHEVGQAYGYKQFNVVGNVKPRARVKRQIRASSWLLVGAKIASQMLYSYNSRGSASSFIM